MRKKPRADWRLKSTTSAVIAASRSRARGSAGSVDPAGSPSKTTDGGVAAIAAMPSDGAEPSACGSDFAVSSDNRRRPRQPMDGPCRTPSPFIAYPGCRGDAEAGPAPPQGGGHRSLPVLGPSRARGCHGSRRWFHLIDEPGERLVSVVDDP